MDRWSISKRLAVLVSGLLGATILIAAVGLFSTHPPASKRISVLRAMGGNGGIQALTVVTRAIALGELEFSSGLRAIGKEVSVAIVIGIVTGAGQGIGRAIATRFAAEGARVMVADFNREMGEETVALIRASGGEASFSFGDVSDEDSVRAMLDEVITGYGRLDIACNSAALSRGSGPIHEYTREVFEEALQMCLTNTWLCMKYELEHMLARGCAHLVTRWRVAE